MPEPRGSPSESPIDPSDPSDPSIDGYPYLAQLELERLTSPVPNLASTLITQAEQDAEEENVSFLRRELVNDEEAAEDYGESRRRMRRTVDAMVGGRRYTPAQLRDLADLDDRVERVVQQGTNYVAWVPDYSDDDEEEDEIFREISARAQSTSGDHHGDRRDENLRDRMRLRRWRDHFAAQAAEAHRHQEPHRGPPPHEQSRFVENGLGSAPSTESSLRTTAMLQAVRRNNQFSNHSRAQLQRYIVDRERNGHDEERDRASPWIWSQDPSQSQRRRSQSGQRETSVRDVRDEIQAHRNLLVEHQNHRNYLEEQLRQQQRHGTTAPDVRRRRMWLTQSPCQPVDKKALDATITYLSSLRLCESDDEAIETAVENDIDREEFVSNDRDFLLDTTLIAPPPFSSYLQVGGTLSGTQHAASAPFPTYTPLGRREYRLRTRAQLDPRVTSPARSSSHSDEVRARSRAAADEERWPVKVKIHSVDYENMSLTGTMEAFNVPDKLSPTMKSSITTYLEGEIIDFNNHTLETKNYEAGTRVDGTYWRKLPPFNGLKDDETMVKCLLSKKWLEEELMGKWILMRWKEKCFVTPSDAGSTLTISGFYYVSLRRADGHVEGLYYDPQSTPYQHLSLMPEKQTFPAYAFQ